MTTRQDRGLVQRLMSEPPYFYAGIGAAALFFLGSAYLLILPLFDSAAASVDPAEFTLSGLQAPQPERRPDAPRPPVEALVQGTGRGGVGPEEPLLPRSPDVQAPTHGAQDDLEDEADEEDEARDAQTAVGRDRGLKARTSASDSGPIYGMLGGTRGESAPAPLKPAPSESPAPSPVDSILARARRKTGRLLVLLRTGASSPSRRSAIGAHSSRNTPQPESSEGSAFTTASAASALVTAGGAPGAAGLQASSAAGAGTGLKPGAPAAGGGGGSIGSGGAAAGEEHKKGETRHGSGAGAHGGAAAAAAAAQAEQEEQEQAKLKAASAELKDILDDLEGQGQRAVGVLLAALRDQRERVKKSGESLEELRGKLAQAQQEFSPYPALVSLIDGWEAGLETLILPEIKQVLDKEKTALGGLVPLRRQRPFPGSHPDVNRAVDQQAETALLARSRLTGDLKKAWTDLKSKQESVERLIRDIIRENRREDPEIVKKMDRFRVEYYRSTKKTIEEAYEDVRRPLQPGERQAANQAGVRVSQLAARVAAVLDGLSDDPKTAGVRQELGQARQKLEAGANKLKSVSGGEGPRGIFLADGVSATLHGTIHTRQGYRRLGQLIK